MANPRFASSSVGCLIVASIRVNVDNWHHRASRTLHLGTLEITRDEPCSDRRSCVVVLQLLHAQICGVHYQANGIGRRCAQSWVADCVVAYGSLTTVQVVVVVQRF